jgi:AraC-like DNA-binding protein/mannose-6-phosphate isomerase-like protein (cupin superfamily)
MMTKNIANKTKEYGDDFPELLLNCSKRIISTCADYPKGLSYPLHHHIPCQFLYISKGVMTVGTDEGTWVVPESHAVWIPTHIGHSIEALGHLTLRNLYIQPYADRTFPKRCGVVSVSSLLQELIVYAADFSTDYLDNSHEDRVMDVIFDLLEKSETAPFLLPSPVDKRLTIITNGLLNTPGNTRTLAKWAKEAGTTERTVTRLFKKETGMSFEQWRRQARLMQAIQRLSAGEQVTSISFDLGYSSVSAFVAMFKKELGRTPGQFLA